MTITLTWQTVITASAVIAAITAICAAIVKAVHWFDRQKKQDNDIAALRDKHNRDIKQQQEEFAAVKHELTLLTYGVLACLKGLKEQGCNGAVTETIKKIEKYLNQKAHDEEVF